MTTETHPYQTTVTLPVRVYDAEGRDTGQIKHITVVAHPTDTPGLVVTPGVSGGGFTGAWALTHAASGYQIPVTRWDAADFDDALQVAKALGATAVDWTSDKDSVLEQISANTEAVQAAVREGRYPTPEPDGPDAPKGEGPAPYPMTDAQATADTIARHLIDGAQHRFAQTWKLINRRDDDGQTIYLNNTAALIAQWALASVLRDFAAVDQEAADHAARQVWCGWEDGETVHELTWQWAREYGLPEPANNDEPAT